MNIPTLETLREYVDAGLIKATRSTQYPSLTVYNYTRKCTFDSAWDDVTRQCRGLILDDAGRCVARPWPKFFNLGEKDAEDPPARLPDSVTVKEDGSLGIGFVYQGRMIWSTRGTIDSPQAAVAQRIWNEQYGDILLEAIDNLTLLCEIVGPETKVIVDYEDPELILLGAIRTKTGEDLPYGNLEDLADGLDMPIVEEKPFTLADLQALKSTLPASQEGYVARWGTLRLKVKGDAYCRIARVLKGFTERRIGDIWYAQEDLPDCLPEESRQWAEQVMSELTEDLRILCLEASALLEQYRTPRAMAMAAKDSPAFPIAVNALRGKPYDDRALVYRLRFGCAPRK